MHGDQQTDALLGRVFDGYRVVRFIARGGMGVVYEAQQESLDRQVVLKFLYPHLSTDSRFRERFEREARAVARLNHHNIVRVLDFGSDGDLHYMVMDYIEGVSLRDRLVRVHGDGLTLKTDTVVSILQQTGAALSYAHEQGYVHRDVKPGNIMLGANGRVFLTDFGVVKLLDGSQMTVTGTMIGTPEYMAPEQGNGTQVGPAADQYALAIVAYEMLVGRVPFQAPTPMALLQKQLYEPPTPPSSLAPWFSPGVDGVLMQALSKQPGDRFPSMTAFINALIAALHLGMTGTPQQPGVSSSSTPTMLATSGGFRQQGQPTNQPGYTPVPGGYTPAPGGYTPAPGGYTPTTNPPGSQPGYGYTPVPAGTGQFQGQGQTDQTGQYGQPGQFQGQTGQYSQAGGPGGEPPYAGGPPPGYGQQTPPPENKRDRTPIIAGVIVLLLIVGIGAFLLATRGGDDNDDNPGGLGFADATATAQLALANTTPTGEAAIATETPAVSDVTATSESTADAGATGTAAVVLPGETPTPEEATATEVVEPTATATTGPTPVIIYTSRLPDQHSPQIYAMGTDGSNVVQIADASGHSWRPQVSPDGTLLFFSSVAGGQHTQHDVAGGGFSGSGNHDVYVANLTGTSLADLNNANLTNVTAGQTSWDNAWAWTPDGTRITFTSDRTGNWEIFTMLPDGSDIVQITNTESNEGWPVWTPDGAHLIYSSDETGDSEIYMVNADGTDVRRLTDRPGYEDLFPEVSPDGTLILFSSQVTSVSEGDIYVMDLDGNNLTRLTSTAALNNIPSWCPGQDQIVFSSDRSGNEDVWIMNSDGSGQVRLTENPGEDTTPTCMYLQFPEP